MESVLATFLRTSITFLSLSASVFGRGRGGGAFVGEYLRNVLSCVE